MTSSTFRALLLEQQEREIESHWHDLSMDRLPEGDVTLEVHYSSLNYKDALAVSGRGKIARSFPMVPGIDLAGTVVESNSNQFKIGDPVISTGWGVGESHWGGYAQIARLKSEWLSPLPDGFSLRDCMAIGTAGLTAMLCVMAIKEHGATTDGGPVLITGASGGVGSIATALLSQLGYQVTAVSGRSIKEPYLRQLGASEVISREDILTKRPLDRERWQAAVDVAAGPLLASVLATMKYGGSVAACGLAGGHDLPASIFPFILRGVNLLGIDSVYAPQERRQQAWRGLAQQLPKSLLSGEMVNEIALADIQKAATDLLNGELQGRIVVNCREE